jgi:hypothetical protein
MNVDEQRRREAEQREAQRAVQRSLDRRDRGGEPGSAAATLPAKR